MRRSGRIATTLATGTVATALALATGAPAQGATSSWRVVFSHHYGAAANSSGYTTGVATSAKNAWAFGGTDLSHTIPGAPVAEHWNGTSWTGRRLPSGLTDSIVAASAPAAKDVWAVTGMGGNILRWNGSTWSLAKHLSGSGQLTGVTAVSASNVWVFGAGGFTGGLGTWHYNGSTWTHLTTGAAAGVDMASPVSAASMWAIGSVSAPDDSIVHYYRGTWRTLTAKALSGLQFTDILAESGSDVWAAATSATNSFKPLLLNYNGSTWTRFPLPWPVGPMKITSDGHGGSWLTAIGRSGQSWIIHRTASGGWARTQITSGSMVAPLRVPGTTSVWGFGLAPVAGTTGSAAAVWGHGKAAG